ncbi:MAG: glycosyltransferase family 39 protein, partial [Candidatus Rokuibacteriota bacterium]
AVISRRTELILVLTLCAVGLWLRLAGVSYGLPDYIYHEDTPKQLHRVPDFFRGQLIPEDTYPTLHMYIVALLLKGLALLDPHGFEGGPTLTQVAVTARVLNAVFGAGIIVLVYLTGRWLFGWAVGLLAAALASLSSLHVLHAHYEMGDITQTFFVTMSFAAAARVLLVGRPSAFVLAGAAAGVAASAKYYGAVVLGTLVVAALPGLRAQWRRRLALLTAAAAAAVAAFVVTTPKLLLTPLDFLAEIGDAFVTAPPPPLWRRPAFAGTTLLGVSLEWFGLLFVAAVIVGIVVAIRRGPRGFVLLATPALVVGLYVIARSHRLDERNLVILAPFLFLLVAMAVAWLGERSRGATLVATGVAAALLATAALDVLYVTYLFREDDTRVFALRWLEQQGASRDKVLTVTYHDSVEAYQAYGAELLKLDSKEWWWEVAWYVPRPSAEARRALEFLAARGKLLKRFELLPRSFISPTLAYYDLDSMAVPHAFPPPDDVARGAERLIFLADDAVPDPVSLFVDRRRPVSSILVSRTPMDEVSVALSGLGRVEIRHGSRRVGATLASGESRIVRLRPRRAFPWFLYFYPITIEAREGHVVARLLTTPCEVAGRLLVDRQWAAAVPHLTQCQGRRWEEPARLLDLAWAHVQLGHLAEARRTLEALHQVSPGLPDSLAGLV